MDKEELLRMYAVEPNPEIRGAYEKSLKDLRGVGEKHEFLCEQCASTFDEYPEVVNAPWYLCPFCKHKGFLELRMPTEEELRRDKLRRGKR